MSPSPSAVTPSQVGKRVSARRVGALLFFLIPTVMIATAPSAPAAPASEIPLLRFGYSRSIFDDVNENDAQAALMAHSEAISRSTRLTSDIRQAIYGTTAALQKALDAEEVEVLSLTTVELLALRPASLAGLILAPIQGKAPGDEYLCVVRRSSNLTTVAELKGRRVLVQQSSRAPLSLTWLNVLTLRAGLGPAERAFGKMTIIPKPSRAALPVYFGQADAAIVTRRSLEVIGELNPQVARELRVLAVSAPMVASALCFRATVPPATIDQIAEVATGLSASMSGRQLLTIFHTDRLERHSPDILDNIRALLAEQSRLMAAEAMPPNQPNPRSTPASVH